MHYGEPVIRKSVPLLVSISNPQLPILDTLAGTNNARLAQMLRHHRREPERREVLVPSMSKAKPKTRSSRVYIDCFGRATADYIAVNVTYDLALNTNMPAVAGYKFYTDGDGRVRADDVV
ncbi:hypothetical protein B0H17DRAFT_1192105 [Mycena rosella]|uniref:Uncharacterized protein n=1 Tax=Mycena rosella TaxID=1033263 RepID=A0AAD7MA19_MYCRO|nr:hypothetical protein B0H17DRAFT_1192105 [Mycena rosella]